MENIKCTPVIVIIFVDSFASVVLLCKICESSLLGEQYMNGLISTEEVNVFKPVSASSEFQSYCSSIRTKDKSFYQEYMVILFSSKQILNMEMTYVQNGTLNTTWTSYSLGLYKLSAIETQ